MTVSSLSSLLSGTSNEALVPPSNKEGEIKEKISRKAYFKSLPLIHKISPKFIFKNIINEAEAKFINFNLNQKKVKLVRDAFRKSAVVRFTTPLGAKFIIIRFKVIALKKETIGIIILKEIFKNIQNMAKWDALFTQNRQWVFETNQVDELEIPNGWVFDLSSMEITMPGSINDKLVNIKAEKPQSQAVIKSRIDRINALASDKGIINYGSIIVLAKIPPASE